jgi:hypothetical protein
MQLENLSPDTSKNQEQPLKPRLASIQNACRYMGDVSRAKFYADILPHLETVHFGKRHFVVVQSMDRFITARRRHERAKSLKPPIRREAIA